MKKIVAIILTALCLMCLVACGKNNDVSEGSKEETSLDKCELPKKSTLNE